MRWSLLVELTELVRKSNKYWAVVKTKQSSSKDARVNLRNQDFEFFHLTFRARSVRGVRKVTALFPYYLIVRIDERKNDPRVIHSTKGVSTIVGKVRNDDIRYFRSVTEKTDDGQYRYVDPTHEAPRFDLESSVCGLRGLFHDKYGTYKGLAGNRGDRVRVLFNILGRDAEFEVNAVDLVAVAA